MLVNVSESAAPPLTPPIVPAVPAVAPRRKTSVFCVPGIGQPRTASSRRRVLDRDRRLGVDAVGDALQLVVEPAVQRVDPLGAALLERIGVARAQQPQLALDVVGARRVPPHADVVHPDVVVLEAVDDEDGRLDLAGVLVVVAVAPELVDVAVLVTVLLVLQRPCGRAQGLARDHLPAELVGRGGCTPTSLWTPAIELESPLG